MKRRQLGSLSVSVIGLGGNNFGTDFFGKTCDEAAVSHIVNAALDSGINLIDTAEEYSVTSSLGEGHSEELIGVALRNRRDEAVISTKFSISDEGMPDQIGAPRIVAVVEASLRRLGTDRIDLYQQHKPDPRVPLDEMLGALDRLIRDGKVREIGCCNFTGAQLSTARDTARHLGFEPFQSCQLQFSVLERPPSHVLAAAMESDTGVLAYFPLASGLLTGKYRRGKPPPIGSRLGADGPISAMLREGRMSSRLPLSDERLTTIERLQHLAVERGHSLLELAISWLVCHPAVSSVLTGVTSTAQVTANAAAAAWVLDADDLDAVEAILATERDSV